MKSFRLVSTSAYTHSLYIHHGRGQEQSLPDVRVFDTVDDDDADTGIYSVHDGWGIAPEKGMKGDAIDAGNTTNMDTIAKEHSYRTLAAHGLAVGLSDGLMGNSEVG